MIHKPKLGQIAAKGYLNHPRYRGCVGHWLLREGAGLVAFDASGYGNNGTLTGGPTWAAGQFGPAVNCDGTNDFISIPDSPSLQFTTAISLSLWTKNNVTPGAFDGVVGKVSDGNWSDGFGLYYDTTTTLSFFVGGYTNAAGTATLTPTAWNHIVGVYDGAAINTYTNGIADTPVSFTGSIATFAVALELGRLSGDSYNINGQLDDVRIYNRALTEGEVSSLYKDQFLEFRVARKRIMWPQSAVAVTVLPKPSIILQAVRRAANW